MEKSVKGVKPDGECFVFRDMYVAYTTGGFGVGSSVFLPELLSLRLRLLTGPLFSRPSIGPTSELVALRFGLQRRNSPKMPK